MIGLAMGASSLKIRGWLPPVEKKGFPNVREKVEQPARSKLISCLSYTQAEQPTRTTMTRAFTYLLLDLVFARVLLRTRSQRYRLNTKTLQHDTTHEHSSTDRPPHKSMQRRGSYCVLRREKLGQKMKARAVCAITSYRRHTNKIRRNQNLQQKTAGTLRTNSEAASRRPPSNSPPPPGPTKQ